MNHLTFRVALGLCASVVLLGQLAATVQAEPRPATHKLGQHPAVLVQLQQRGIDPNHFIVQPPASVTWRNAPAAEPATQYAAPQAPFDETPITAVETAGASRGG